MTLDNLEHGDIEADMLPTEDQKKIISALSSLFPNSNFSESNGKITGSVDLSHFRQLVEKEEIESTVKALLDKNLSGRRSFIDLNKLAACAGRVGIDEDSPIGKIRLHVDWKA